MGIVDWLKSIGVDSSFANRKKLAQQYLGIADYTGTATQNTSLLNALQAAGFGGNGAGTTNSTSNGSDPTEQWIIHDTVPYKGYEIRRGLASYGTTNKYYEINCNCNAVGFNAPGQTATTEAQARTILDSMVNQAKQAIDNYLSNQSSSGNTNSGTDWSGASTNSVQYNGHTITMYLLQNGSNYSAKITCSGPVVNDSQERTGMSQATLATWVDSVKNQYKAQIDAGATTNPETPEAPTNPETPTTPTTGSDPTEQRIIHDTVPYKGYEIRRGLASYGTTNKQYEINCNCNAVGFNAPGQTATNENQARTILDNMVNQAKQAIDNYIANGGTPTTPSTGDEAPRPQIVFGQAATTEGGAGPNYQTRRNQGIADMIYDIMNGKTYTTGQQAQRDFRDQVMAIVNANGGNLQIGADGSITGENAQSWKNTVSLIKQYLLGKFGYSNWNDFVAGGNGSGTGNGGTGNNTGTGGFTTGSGAADNTWNTIQAETGDLYSWLNQRYTNSMNGWNTRKDEIGDYGAAIADRINSMNNTFNGIAANMNNASELQKKAQRIYSNQNIEKMNQQLRQMGYDAGAAAPAVYYQATKQMANVAIEYYKLAAEEQTALAELEAQKAQLIDNIKAAGIEADQWTKNMLNEVEKQIQQIRDNFVTQKSDILGKYTLQPMLDVMSNQLEADIQNIADMYENQFVNANPEMKMIAAARLYGSDWYYVDPNVAMNYNAYPTYGEYLIACANSIKNNKVTAEKQIAQAGATVYGNVTNSGNNQTQQQTQTYYLD